MSKVAGLGCGFFSIVFLLASVAWLTIFVLVRDQAKLDEIEDSQREDYSEGFVARAVFRRGSTEGVAVFRRGRLGLQQPTKLVLGVTGLDPTLRYMWYIIPGGGGACIDGRYSAGGGREHGAHYVDMSVRHGPLRPMARRVRDVPTSSILARVVYDRQLRFSGSKSILGGALVLSSPTEGLHNSLCAGIYPEEDRNDAVDAPNKQPKIAHGVCIFDVDMTLTCGGDCASPECDFADPVAGATCMDTAVTSGYRAGYPLRFNVGGTKAVLAWCAARDFVPAIATHGSVAEVEHVGNCSFSKMTYVKRLLGIDDAVVCQDVRDLMLSRLGTRCVYGGSAWTETGGQTEKVTKDNHVQAILRSFVPAAASQQEYDQQYEHQEEDRAPMALTAAPEFRVMFFDDGLANQRDVLLPNGYALGPAESSELVRAGRTEVVVTDQVRAAFPNADTVRSSGGWGNPNSCGLVEEDLQGLGVAAADGWMLQARP